LSKSLNSTPATTSSEAKQPKPADNILVNDYSSATNPFRNGKGYFIKNVNYLSSL